MRLTVARHGTLLAALVSAALVAVTGVFLLEFPFGDWLKRASYNLLHVARGDTRVDEAVVVYLDEASYDELKQPMNLTLDRSFHARLVDRLTVAGAKVVVFDIVFTDLSRDNPAGDEAFARALARNGRVILAADNVPLPDGGKRMFRPDDLFLTNAVTMGSAEVQPDPDIVVRLHQPQGKDDFFPTLSWSAAEFVKAPVTRSNDPTRLSFWNHYYGRPNALPSVSYYQALDTNQVNDSFFRDKAVFIGGKLLTKLVGHRKDEYANPYSFWLRRSTAAKEGGLFMAGVEGQATMFLNLVRGDWLSRLSRVSEALFVAALGLLFGFILVRFRSIAAMALAAAGLAAVAGASYAAFRHGLWFPWLIVAVQIATALTCSILYNSFQYYAQKRLMEHTLSLYLSPKLVGKFARNPKLLQPGAEKQVLTILFTDIENFTTMAQDMDSNELAEFMNRYFQNIVAKCIHPADGTVVKYIGDAVFSFWNAPEAQPDHALRACEAVLRMRDLEEVKLRGHTVRTRVGIHTGEANVGNFGSVERVDYTALGENVNLASRLEGLNKFLGTDCLISADTRAAVGDKLVVRRVGLFTLKGFSKSVEVFEIVGRPDVAEKTKEWREAFEQALRNYEDGNFEFATIGFREVLELKPDDGPTKFYLDRLDDVSKQPIEGDWTGVTMLKEK